MKYFNEQHRQFARDLCKCYVEIAGGYMDGTIDAIETTRKLYEQGYRQEKDTVLDIYRMLWEAEIMYMDNGEMVKADAMMNMRRMIKLKYDAKEEG